MTRQVRLRMNFGSGREIEAGTLLAEGTSCAVTLGRDLDRFRIPGMAGGNFTAGNLPYWLADALPDAWGQRVMLHEMLKAGLSVRNVTVADQLAYIGACGLGCWHFAPALDLPPELDRIADLGWLREQALMLLDNRDCDLAWMQGSLSLGGARPKLFIDIEADGTPSLARLARDRSHILKLPGPNDAADAGRWEVAYARLARAFGMDVPPCELVQGEYFAVRRFDAADGRRYLLRTLASLNEAPHTDAARNSYDSILDHLGALCGSYRQALQVAKLALFNHLTFNWDDHAKNVSFMMDGDGNWRLAPFYDLTYNLALGTHAMALNGTTMPAFGDFAETFGIFGIDVRVLRREIALLREALGGEWQRIAAGAGLDPAAAARRQQEILAGLDDF